MTFYIADNQAISKRGLEAYIKELFEDKADIVGVEDRKQLTAELEKNANSGIVVLDYTLFDIPGVEEFLLLTERFRQVDWLLFSTELSDTFVRRLGAEPKVSILLKDNSEEEIISALRCTAKGERYLCHQVVSLLLSERETHNANAGENELTPTEKEILKLIAMGKTVKEIASIRISSIHTITTHKKNIFRKLRVNNVYEATKYALRAGLVEMSDYYI
jgi:DNA-binding NarL/FixJ family response regulator